VRSCKQIARGWLLPKTSASLRLLQVLRDEAHRFALKNHREQRAKSTLISERR
jgi:excinuclease ABC subunit C